MLADKLSQRNDIFITISFTIPDGFPGFYSISFLYDGSVSEAILFTVLQK